MAALQSAYEMVQYANEQKDQRIVQLTDENKQLKEMVGQQPNISEEEMQKMTGTNLTLK